MAVQHHGADLLESLASAIQAESLSTTPFMLVEQGRVAIGDEIGYLLGARAVIVIIGERPGLSSPDSLGIYYTFAPRLGLKDDRRNCISNIRPDGLSLDAACEKMMWLLRQSFTKKLSGVALKDLSTETENDVALNKKKGNFLLGDSSIS